MKLTGQCKQDFEDYLRDTNYGNMIVELIPFYHYPEPMKFGVFEDFFDSVGISLTIGITVDTNTYKDFEFDYGIAYIKGMIGADVKTRPEAREQSIEKANEIYNKQ